MNTNVNCTLRELNLAMSKLKESVILLQNNRVFEISGLA
jgi:hypothetical protein